MVSGTNPNESIEFYQCTQFFRPREALGVTQPLSEMSTKTTKKHKVFGGYGVRPVREANLTAICDPLV
jgi:hypothetical protein